MESPAQLHFEDTTMGFDYMCSHFRRRPSSASSPVPGDQPRMSISSIVNPSSARAAGGEFDSASGFVKSSTQMVEPASIWPSYSDLSSFYGNTGYQISQEFLSTPCDTSMDYYFQGRMADTSPYDYSFPINYNTEATSLTCPRSYQPEFEMVPTETVVQSIEAYPPSSYLMDPQKHQSYMATSPQPIGSDALAAEQDQGVLNRPQIGYDTKDALYDHASPAPSSHTDKTELRASPSSNKDRASEDADPQYTVGDDMDGGEDEANQPYAQLIYKALMSTPEHKMVLTEIYNWFRNNFEKYKKAKGKGWQNSIRHNLSMNGAFTKVEKADDSAKGFIWVLEPVAVRDGVKSTTRYRKGIIGKKGATGKTEGGRGQAPAAAPYSSGRRVGGKSTKKIWKASGGKVRKSERTATATSSSGGNSSTRNPQAVISAPSFASPADSSSPSASSSSPPAPPPPPPLIEPDPSWNFYVDPISTYTKQENPPFLFQDVVGVSTPYRGEPFFCEPSSIGTVGEEGFAYGQDGLVTGFFGDVTGAV
ncbi:MAG: hypothetical protein M1839_006092 [Geoglossum umbratile]|nr:MAG: hypothetical protein M1839_006092 [Geoglossum umbratile]